MSLAEIETVVIVIMENRSFDHMLGYLSLPGGNGPMPVEGLSDTPAWLNAWANLCAGTPYPPHRIGPQIQQIDDPTHDHIAINLQITTPPVAGPPELMGGFVQSYETFGPTPSDRSLVMGYYDQEAVPVFDFFARNFAVCDHWFASLPTGTQANRLMAMSGTSGIVDNAPVFLPEQDLVYDWLTAHSVTWCAYQSGDWFPFFSLMPSWLPEIATSLSLSAIGGRGRFRRYTKFAEQWASTDSMPNVIFIEPEYTDGPHTDPNDDHPMTGQAKGQVFLADIYNTLIRNPGRWANTMMIVTYDEHGAFFDHVHPLPIPTTVAGFEFKTTGVRVPAFVVSPRVAAGTVFSEPLDHTSLLQLLADRFNAGQTYSAAVGARQSGLSRIAKLLGAARAVPAPIIPAGALAAIKAAADRAPIAPSAGSSPADPANAQALHNVALKVAKDHPDLIAGPGWQSVSQYVQATGAVR